MQATPIEFCFISSRVHCQVFWQNSLYYLEYLDEGNWWLAFTKAGYLSIPQFIAYLVEI